MQTIMVFVTID